MELNKEKILQAGKIASQIRKYSSSIIKKGTPLKEIAESIEGKIIELGAKPAFPVNLSINEIAAHYTPGYDDISIAFGLLKVDIGVHVDGWIADTAFSIDLENSKENQQLINAAENALKNAIDLIKQANSKTELNDIGSIIQKTIESNKYIPIINLSGHSIERYDLHAGMTIPNINDNIKQAIEEGVRAIEPFSTLSTGSGKVNDGKYSGIYVLINGKNIRSPIARELLEHISKEYETLPFCSRWLVNKFGTKALFGLKQLEENGNLYQFKQLIESSRSKVAQAEHTLIIEKKDTIITTE